MQFPSVPFVLACSSAFQKRAEYTLSMLGLIAGFRPDFSGADPANAIHYGYDPLAESAGWVPASIQSHDFLAVKRRYLAKDAADVSVDGRALLRLFQAGEAAEGDIVAAAFFFLSLHEEWSSEARDAFGRFQAKDSLLGVLGLLDRPVIAEYAQHLSAKVRKAGFEPYDGPRYDGKQSAVCITHDIDYITKFTPGLIYREAVKYLLLNGTRQPFGARAKRFGEYLRFCLTDDPYRLSLRKMQAEEEKRGVRGTWYFKAGGRDKRDTGYSPSHTFVRGAIESLRDAGHEIGLHPSFHAHADEAMFAAEREALFPYSGPVAACRQHYLRFAYPRTLRIQAGQGITTDSTLGYAEHEGFRNGTCHPFQPYDLDCDEVIPVWEVPLAVMDGTLNAYRGLDAGASKARMEEIMDIVRNTNGIAVLLFHNVVYDSHDFPGWNVVFESVLDAVDASDRYSAGITPTVRAWLKGSDFRLE